MTAKPKKSAPLAEVDAIRETAAKARANPAHDFFKPLPRLVVIGNSHAGALVNAQEAVKEGDRFDVFEIYQVRKEKGAIEIGNISTEQFLKLAAELGEEDYVISAVGGNQYAMLSTVRNPIDFDVLSGPKDREIGSDEAMLIPNRAFEAAMLGGVRTSIGTFLGQLRKATKANIIHLSAPPPKGDNDFIAANFERHFSSLGLDKLGPSRPSLRLKAWTMQTRLVRKYCAKYGVTFFFPPKRTLTKEGFLDPRFYAKDATHANRRYGRDLFKQVLLYVHAQLGNVKKEFGELAVLGKMSAEPDAAPSPSEAPAQDAK